MSGGRGGTGTGGWEGGCGALALLLLAWAVLPPLAGCGPRARRPATRPQALPLAVQVYADTGRGERLSVRPPAARAWLARVTPTRAAPPAPALPLPEAGPDSPPPSAGAAPALEVDAGLKPPVLRAPARLLLPQGRRAVGSVELDVRVDEDGAVSAALWAAGSADTSLLEAARRCALTMRFYPALRAGRPVAVWCRQRFDFGATVTDAAAR